MRHAANRLGRTRFGFQKFTQKRGRRTSSRASRQFESLETRALLTVTFIDGHLTVTGTEQVDLIQLDRNDAGDRLVVRINGTVESNRLLSSIVDIDIFGLRGNDQIVIANIAKPISVDGGEDVDDVDVDSLSIAGKASANNFVLDDAALTVNGKVYDFSGIEQLRFDGDKSGDTLTIANFPDMQTTFNGFGGFDEIVGNNDANIWGITSNNGGGINGKDNFAYTGVENLTGGSNTDAFYFFGSKRIDGNIDGGSGADTITYANYNAAVIVNLRTNFATGTGGAVNVEEFFGGSGSNTLVGKNEVTIWNITGTNDGNVYGIDFTNFQNLTGDSKNDTFKFGAFGNITGRMDGKGGTDVVDYTDSTNNLSVRLSNLPGIQRVLGSTTAVTSLVGSNTDFEWRITAENFGKAGDLVFDGVKRLIGGSKRDTFLFSDGDLLTEGVDGGTGSDAADFSKFTSVLEVDLAKTIVERVVGGQSNNDTVIGRDATNTWNITQTNVGTVGSTAFSGFENLEGGDANDSFVFANGAGISGKIDGGTGRNTLNYAAYTTKVTVNLSTRTATKVGGAAAGKVSHIRDVIGGTQDDTLTGDNQNNLLAGNAGKDTLDGGDGNDTLGGGDSNDTIKGGNDRDLLFGGLGLDTLDGGAGEDILFDGTNTFDSSIASLDALLTAWTLSDDYATRVEALREGDTGVPGAPLLISETVMADTVSETLTGGADLDWFFLRQTGANLDSIFDPEAGEEKN
jgi:hypothetical protein